MINDYLCNVVETHRVESEVDADALIEEARNSNMYDLTKSSIAHKEVKAKGEIIDEYYLVVLTKFIQEHKTPSIRMTLKYEV